MPRIGAPYPYSIRSPTSTAHPPCRNTLDPFLLQRTDNPFRRDLDQILFFDPALRHIIGWLDGISELGKAIVSPREDVSSRRQSERMILSESEGGDGMRKIRKWCQS